MNRRNIFKLALCAVAASAMEVFGMKPIKAPDQSWTTRVIQAVFDGSRPFQEPPEHNDTTLELVWERVAKSPEFGETLHQRMYAPVGMWPDGLPEYMHPDKMMPFTEGWREVIPSDPDAKFQPVCVP